MARRPPPDALALATAPRSPAPAPPDVAIRRTCKICGEPTQNVTGLCRTHQNQVLSLKEERALVVSTLSSNAHRYAELHKAGAEIAASRGDTRPAEWALLHTRMIEPLKQAAEGGRVVVNIGMVLPGLPGSAPTVTLLPSPDDTLEGEVS